MLNCFARCTGRKHHVARLQQIVAAPNNVFEMQDRVGECPWCNQGVFVRTSMLAAAENDYGIKTAWLMLNYYGTDLLKLQDRGHNDNFYVEGLHDPLLRGHPIGLRCEHIYHLGCILDMRAGIVRPTRQPVAQHEVICTDNFNAGCIAMIPQPGRNAGQVEINIPTVNATASRLLQLLYPRGTNAAGETVFTDPLDQMQENPLYGETGDFVQRNPLYAGSEDQMQRNPLYNDRLDPQYPLVAPYAVAPVRVPTVEFYDVLPNAATSATDTDYVDVRGSLNGDTTTDETSFMGNTAIPRRTGASIRRRPSVSSVGLHNGYGYPTELFDRLRDLRVRGEYMEFYRAADSQALPNYSAAMRMSSRPSVSTVGTGYLSRADLGTGAAGTTGAGYFSPTNLGVAPARGNHYAGEAELAALRGNASAGNTAADVIDFGRVPTPPQAPIYAPLQDYRRTPSPNPAPYDELLNFGGAPTLPGAPEYAPLQDYRRTPSPIAEYETIGAGAQPAAQPVRAPQLPPRREGTVLFEQGVFLHQAFAGALQRDVKVILDLYRASLPIADNPQAAAVAARSRCSSLTGKQIFAIVLIAMLLIAATVIPLFAVPGLLLNRGRGSNNKSNSTPVPPIDTTTTSAVATTTSSVTGIPTSTLTATIENLTTTIASTTSAILSSSTSTTLTTAQLSTIISTTLTTAGIPVDTTTLTTLTSLATSAFTSTTMTTTPTTSSSTSSTTMTSTLPTTSSTTFTTTTTPTTSSTTTSTTPTTTELITTTITRAMTSTFVTTTTSSTTATTTPTTSSTTTSSTTPTTSSTTTSTTTPTTTSSTTSTTSSSTTSSTTPTTTTTTTSSTTPTTTTFTTTTTTTTPTTTTTTMRTTTLVPTTSTVPSTVFTTTRDPACDTPFCKVNPPACGCGPAFRR